MILSIVLTILLNIFTRK
ncbi:hypothetical protein [Phosphitispora sp. TUW77]